MFQFAKYYYESRHPRVYFIYRGDLAPSCVNCQQDSAIYTNADQAFVNAILKNANELQSANCRLPCFSSQWQLKAPDQPFKYQHYAACCCYAFSLIAIVRLTWLVSCGFTRLIMPPEFLQRPDLVLPRAAESRFDCNGTVE